MTQQAISHGKDLQGRKMGTIQTERKGQRTSKIIELIFKIFQFFVLINVRIYFLISIIYIEFEEQF